MNAFPINDPRLARIVADIRKSLSEEPQLGLDQLAANFAVMAEESRRERDRADGDLLLPLPTLNDLKVQEDGDGEEHPDDNELDDDSSDTQPDGRAVTTLKRVPPNTPPDNDAYYSAGKLSQFVLSSDRKPASVQNSRTKSALQGDDPLPLTGAE